MNIDVQLEGEEKPRRFRVLRDGAGFVLRRLQSEPGEELRVDLRSPASGVYSLIVDGRSYDVHVDQDAADEEDVTVHLLSRVVRARAADARKRRVAKAGVGPDGVVRLTAPIPGRVVKVLAPAGTAVKRGDGIIVLEAMKMENELVAERGGTVSQLPKAAGQAVDTNDLLVELT